jgi:uncharacterized membrane protein YtjA (UPF0391 family)
MFAVTLEFTSIPHVRPRLPEAGNAARSSTLTPANRYFQPYGETPMLTWALIFLVVALVAGVLGFTGIAGASIAIAKLLFVVFLVLFVVSLIMHLIRGRTVV